MVVSAADFDRSARFAFAKFYFVQKKGMLLVWDSHCLQTVPNFYLVSGNDIQSTLPQQQTFEVLLLYFLDEDQTLFR